MVYLAYFVFNFVLNAILQVSFGGAAAMTISASGAPVFGPGYFLENGIILVIGLALLVPSLAIAWRRLHDPNRSGGYFFMAFIPIAGPIILIVFLAGAPNPAGARFDRSSV